MSWTDLLEETLNPTTLVEVPYRRKAKKKKKVTK